MSEKRIIERTQTYTINGRFVIVDFVGCTELQRVDLNTVANNAKVYSRATSVTIKDACGLGTTPTLENDPEEYNYPINDESNYLTTADFADAVLTANLYNADMLLDAKIKEEADKVVDLQALISEDDEAKIIGNINEGVSHVIDTLTIDDTAEEELKVYTLFGGNGKMTIVDKDHADTDIGFKTCIIHFRDETIDVLTESEADFFAVTDTPSRLCILEADGIMSIKNNTGYNVRVIYDMVFYNEAIS